MNPWKMRMKDQQAMIDELGDPGAPSGEGAQNFYEFLMNHPEYAPVNPERAPRKLGSVTDWAPNDPDYAHVPNDPRNMNKKNAPPDVQEWLRNRPLRPGTPRVNPSPMQKTVDPEAVARGPYPRFEKRLPTTEEKYGLVSVAPPAPAPVTDPEPLPPGNPWAQLLS